LQKFMSDISSRNLEGERRSNSCLLQTRRLRLMAENEKQNLRHRSDHSTRTRIAHAGLTLRSSMWIFTPAGPNNPPLVTPVPSSSLRQCAGDRCLNRDRVLLVFQRIALMLKRRRVEGPRVVIVDDRSCAPQVGEDRRRGVRAASPTSS